MSRRRLVLPIGLVFAVGCGESLAAPPAPIEPAPACVPEAFVHAPQPVEIDGLLAVPIDVLGLDAELVFDRATDSGHAIARLSFQLGRAGGMPTLDLRQSSVERLTLDGEQLPLELFARHDFGRGSTAGLVILAVELEPCSVHELELGYAITTPDAPGAEGPEFSPDGARFRFDLFASDLNPGRYLESWLPANSVWDRHSISLMVELAGASLGHALISNAAVDELDDHVWQLEFPSTTTSMDPMLVILPIDELLTFEAASNGVPMTIHATTEAALAPALIADQVDAAITRFARELGPYPHPDVTVLITRDGRSMEYAAATTSTIRSLEHELVHLWWGRGLSPAHASDGWIDEGYAVYMTDPTLGRPTAFDWTEKPIELRDPHPFARVTPRAAYEHGALLFAGIAKLVGAAELRAAMAEVQREVGMIEGIEGIGSISTVELERRLFCALGQRDEIRHAFHRFVHGREGELEPVAVDPCLR